MIPTQPFKVYINQNFKQLLGHTTISRAAQSCDTNNMPESSQQARRTDPILPQGQSPLDYAVTRRDRGVLQMIKEAVKHEQAMLAYQPIVHAQSQSSVAFYEGLVRLQDETGRVIPARDFLPLVEDNELGRELDRLALQLGCRALSEVPSLRLSINMSARSIGYSPWTRALDEWLERDSSIGERLILEITESSAMVVPELVVDFMDRLQLRGICFALDDFGAGYTALRYFKDFFFDIMKLDGQFIRGIAHDPDNRVLTQAMLTIGKQFDMLVVAEMVEDAQDAAVLNQIGVDCLQGYLFGAPTTRPAWMTSINNATRAASG